MTTCKCRVAAAWAAAAMAGAGAWSVEALGQGAVAGAQAAATPAGTLTVKGTFNPAKMPTGLSIAGGWAYQANKGDVQLSGPNNANAGPNKDEMKAVKGLLDNVQTLATGVTVQNRKDRTSDFDAAALKATAEDKKAGNFVKIDKSKGLTATVSVKQGDRQVGNETATATATQKVAGGTVDTKGTMVSTTAFAGDAVGSAPKVSAVAVNRDPTVANWTSASDHSAMLELTGSTFSAQTTGLGSTAMATSDYQISYVDGATDPENTAQPSTPILDVLLGVTSTDGGPASSFGALVAYTGGGSLSDSMGGMGAAAVDADLDSVLMDMGGGTFGIVGTYSITFDLGGSLSQGVLFVDNYNLGEAAVPEPAGRSCSGPGPRDFSVAGR